MTIFKDIADSDEDSRIEQIGRFVMEHKKIVSFVTDSDPGKADRYISKLCERFPGLQVIDRGYGPVEGTVWVKVGPQITKKEMQ